MISTGFYHPARGYWQTLGQPSGYVLASYPEGTREVPLKPGADYEFDGIRWQHAPRLVTFDDVNAERDRRIEAGALVTLSDGLVVAVTGRERDKVVLLGLAQQAEKLMAQGRTDAGLLFRDRANTTHLLTSAQMIELYERVYVWVENMMKRSWAMKDGTGIYASMIPDDYDQDSHWPEPA